MNPLVADAFPCPTEQGHGGPCRPDLGVHYDPCPGRFRLAAEACYDRGVKDGADQLRQAASEVLAGTWTRWPDLLHALQRAIGVRDLPTALEVRTREGR